jgi:hypothetical protein
MNSHYLLFVSLLLINTVSLAKETAPTQPATSPTEKASSTATKPSATAATVPDAAILDQGKKLHGDHCVRCHNTSVYTRKNRMIKSYESLKTQVQRCATNLDKPWFDDEVDAVAAYLNANYYLFKEKSPQ